MISAEPDARPGTTVDVVFLHGAGPGAHDEDALLADSLAEHLGDRYAVHFPRLPEDDDPGNRVGFQAIDRALARTRSPVVLVAHSAGGYVLLRYLTRTTPPMPVPVAAICLIATPFPGADAAWTFDGFELPADLDGRLPADAAVLLYASEDDETVPIAHRDRYGAAIPRARVRTTTGGHQLGNDLRTVADDIRALA